MMLSYVNRFRPDFNQQHQGLQITNRAKSALIAGPQLAAGIADIALGFFCSGPALVGMCVGSFDNYFSRSVRNGFKAIDETLPNVFKSVILALNPNGFRNTTKNSEAFFLSQEPLFKYSKTLTAVKNRFLTRHVASRLVAIAGIVTTTTAVALDLLSASVLVAASLLTLGRVNKLNQYAKDSLKLDILHILPFSLIAKVVDPSL